MQWGLTEIVNSTQYITFTYPLSLTSRVLYIDIKPQKEGQHSATAGDYIKDITLTNVKVSQWMGVASEIYCLVIGY